MTPYPLRYLAYGSNLHPERLRRRLGYARLLRTVKLDGFRLGFDKCGKDGSGKCNLHRTAHGLGVAHGAVFEISADGKKLLDGIEGLGKGYREELLDLSGSEHRGKVFAYIAEGTHVDDELRPYSWYRELVVLGAEFHGFPDEYIRSIRGTSVLPDPDIQRCRENEALVREIGVLRAGRDES